MSFRKSPDDVLGMQSSITRRDFVNGALAGSGAALVFGCERSADSSETSGFSTAPKQAALSNTPSGSPWTGYGGVGDYNWSNGNTEAVVNAAHGFRDHLYSDVSERAVDETCDLVIVGGGFSGMTAAYEFNKRRRDGQTCLLLENHPMVGGEAKQNEFDVDGQRLTAPQGSNGGLIINNDYVPGAFADGLYDLYADYYRELELPPKFELQPLAGGAERYNIPNYHFAPMSEAYEKHYEAGYYFRDVGWVLNPTRDGFANAPWPSAIKQEMDDFVNNRREAVPGVDNVDAWLDTLTYHQLLDKLGYGTEVKTYIDPYIAVSNYGISGSGISAYAARRLHLPGAVTASKQKEPDPAAAEDGRAKSADFGVVSFPGGNAAILRRMLARMIPGAISGDGGVAATSSAPVNFDKLDREGAPLRIRLSSTAINVAHDGDPAKANHVIVTYVRDGKIRKIRAGAVVMCCGGWVNRNIVTDMPERLASAYRQFHYGPVMTANVAIRNWRFFDKLGFTAARWFEGLGWQVCVRRNVVLDERRTLTPDDPIVLTFYIPFLASGLPPEQQGPAGRAKLLAPSYADFERQIRLQMMEMFSAAGFDARRDIAGIVLNRWGHAYCAPLPGFFFGKDGAPPPYEAPRKTHGRIAFAHSELQQGTMNMAFGMLEAHRAAGQVMSML